MTSLYYSILSAAGFANSTAFDTKDIPDLTSKIAIITGGNTGLGYETALALLAANCKVYLACRDQTRAEAAIEKLRSVTEKGVVVFLPFDLTDVKSAQNAAKIVLENEKRLDIVVANAAVMAMPYQLVNGLEVQFWNHLGHYALIEPLLPLLIATSKISESSVRIINVSSLGHNFTAVPDFSTKEAVNRETSNTWARYGHSKLANILYTNSLVKRLAGENISILSLHPGNVDTELTRGPALSYGSIIGKILRFGSAWMAMRPLDGAKTQIYAAVSPEVDSLKLNGKYLIPIATIGVPSAASQNEKLTNDLETLSKKLLAELA